MNYFRFMYLRISIVLCLLLSTLISKGQMEMLGLSVKDLAMDQAKKAWADSTYAKMTERERIGQLFMVAAYSNRNDSHEEELKQLIKNYHIGGLIFFQGNPYKQAQMTNRLQAAAKWPMLLAMDAEWGIGMRLDSTIDFPRQLTLGAIRDDRLIYKMGAEIARQTKRIGMHVNFAPVVDVNNNPNNPVINNRSFGEDKFNVALKSLAYMEGMQDNGVMACAKHFPGHGDTDADSHLSLPVIKHDRERLEQLELYPFRILFGSGVQSIMAAHLSVPALDSTPKLPTSMSTKVLKDLLRKEMGFEGLVFSDALNMKGVSNFYKPGELEFLAYKAGNDVLLFAEDVPKAVSLFEAAFDKENIDTLDFEIRVKKILEAKYVAGLANYTEIELKGLTKDLNDPKAQWLNQQLYEAALVLAKNENALIPFKKLDTLSFASLAIGVKEQTTFQEYLYKYAPVDHFKAAKLLSAEEEVRLFSKLKDYDVVFISLHDMSKYAKKNHGIKRKTIDLIERLDKETKVVLTIFGSPYALQYFPELEYLLVGHDESELAQKVAAQGLFGAISMNGRLPVTASEEYPYGMGETTTSLGRLRYTIPAARGLDQGYFESIDSIVTDAIADKATPGCQVLVVKDGQVIFDKSYGHHTYSKEGKVKTNDVYDLASITKIAATTISLMHLYDIKQFQPNRKLSDYLEMPDTASIKDLVIRDVLTHASGLQAWIPFYLKTLDDSIYQELYSVNKKDGFETLVATDLYIKDDYREVILNRIYNAKVNPDPEYKYSDLGFYLFKEITEIASRQPFKEFTNSTFYRPLGLATMGFDPLERLPNSRLIPTEDDQLFRKQVVHGYVHDPGAAMLGGVSGHAGLFSNANDLAILMQMLLNRGEYAGERYLKPRTVQYFTKRHTEDSRRGLGFDKPEPEVDEPGPTSIMASKRTFGHSGFTGTCVWADPDHDLVYVFLSNRVFPKADNYKLIKNNVRTAIHDVIYMAILEQLGLEMVKAEN